MLISALLIRGRRSVVILSSVDTMIGSRNLLAVLVVCCLVYTARCHDHKELKGIDVEGIKRLICERVCATGCANAECCDEVEAVCGCVPANCKEMAK